jgi:ATP-dependent Lon protease
LSGRRVKSDLAMTGEATLRGRVLPIGGVKSKVMAAHRAGFRKVILPKLNERDWPEVPEQVRAEMELITVEDMSEVLGHALELESVTAPPTAPSSGSGTTPSAAA